MVTASSTMQECCKGPPWPHLAWGKGGASIGPKKTCGPVLHMVVSIRQETRGGPNAAHLANAGQDASPRLVRPAKVEQAQMLFACSSPSSFLLSCTTYSGTPAAQWLGDISHDTGNENRHLCPSLKLAWPYEGRCKSSKAIALCTSCTLSTWTP